MQNNNKGGVKVYKMWKKNQERPYYAHQKNRYKYVQLNNKPNNKPSNKPKNWSEYKKSQPENTVSINNY